MISNKKKELSKKDDKWIKLIRTEYLHKSNTCTPRV